MIRLANCDKVIKFTHFPFFSSSKDSPNLGLFHVCHDNISIFLRGDQHCLSGVASNPSGVLFSLPGFAYLAQELHYLRGAFTLASFPQWSYIYCSMESHSKLSGTKYINSVESLPTFLEPQKFYFKSAYTFSSFALFSVTISQNWIFMKNRVK